MDGQAYAELLVKKAPKSSRYAFAFLCIFIPAAISLALALLAPLYAILSVPVIIIAVVVYFAFRKYCDVEFDYRVLSGSFDVDAVYGKKKRVHRFSADLQRAEIIAPQTDEYEAYSSGKYHKVYDFMGFGYDHYFMVTSDEEGRRILCLFSVNKKFLTAMRQANPRAVVMSYGLKD